MNEEKNISDLNINFEQLLEMFTQQWELYAPMVYGFYLKSGRGALYVDLSMVKAEGGVMTPDTFYVPENNLSWLADLIGEKTKNLLKTYDPEKMIIFLLKFKDGNIKTMFIGSEDKPATPKELYEKHQKITLH